ncbi:sigma-70 family RNA polymerase sigma factor [Actinotalea sp.]|uniref:RNA polymerase sigma factor n=1 Tax=Actinotalea sp. TaxID=1872145 RepID=UPI002B704CAD|nr:sigma-70 family RNA polymerase sigma factor [Actinotalea sp.]HQY34668.1 sigma-70 family RNA polymerase sigma factor [Actinotalea sp.]HRA51581.1 sigma-70 family RNA polymerase sigma factor [Actinotalea sp.]
MTPTADGTSDLGVATPSLAARASAALTAYRAGATAPLGELVKELTPMLWRIARAQGCEREEAEDVVQGVWLALVRSAPTIREPDAVLGWLVVSARRAAWRVVARRREDDRRTTQLPDAELTPGRELRSAEAPPDSSVLTAERDRALWRHFLELPARCQQLLRFVATADRPDYAAIAEATGMKVTAVGITRGRCLAKLRTLLDDDEGWLGA